MFGVYLQNLWGGTPFVNFEAGLLDLLVRQKGITQSLSVRRGVKGSLCELRGPRDTFIKSAPTGCQVRMPRGDANPMTFPIEICEFKVHAAGSCVLYIRR